VPALLSSILEPVWVQVAALLPTRQVHHPLGCHRPRIPDRTVFDKLIQVLVFGCGYRRIADATCSATTLRRRRDEWIGAGVAEQLRLAVLAAYDRMKTTDIEREGFAAACDGRRFLPDRRQGTDPVSWSAPWPGICGATPTPASPCGRSCRWMAGGEPGRPP
jgi:transposase